MPRLYTVDMTTKKTTTPKPFKYRLSDKAIATWTKALIIVMIVGIVGGFAFSAIAWSIVGDEDWVMAATYWIIIGLGVGLPLILGGIVGGIAIHRFGYIGTTLLTASMVAFGIGGATGNTLVATAAVIGMVVGGLLTFLFGYLGKVPMWLQLPTFGSPRVYIAKGGKDTAKNKQSVAYVAGVFVAAIIFVALVLLLNR